jgi:membrane-bound lytic murein transglycosylase A
MHVPSRLGGRVAAATFFALASVTAAAQEPGPLKIPNSQLEPVAWSALDGWAGDDHAAGFATFLDSCKAVARRSTSARDTRPMYRGLIDVCRRALKAVPLDGPGARKFFEENFRPLRIAALGDSAGLLTGYYEPIVEGSRIPGPEFTVPLHRRPSNLIFSGRRHNAASFPNRGKVGRQVGRRKIVPYYDRAEIENGALDGRQLEIAWLKDPIEAFFIHIQGSARVRLEDRTVLRVNYDGHNGYPYTPVGRILIERNIVPRDEMSMDRIRQWMQAHPEEAKELRQQNKSYVFFRVTELSDQDEAVGAQGVPLTAVRSIAVDRALHVYGTPFFIHADLPIASLAPTTKFRRLMIAQDTGSAIVGPARADLYFGAGEEAGRISGRMRHQGRFTMLVPKELDPVEAGAKMPLPPYKPPIPVIEASAREPVPLPPPRPKPRSKRRR